MGYFQVEVVVLVVLLFLAANVVASGDLYSSTQTRKLLMISDRVNESTVEQVVPEACSKEDVVVYQDSGAPMPNGIPTYTVQVMNECLSGCTVSDIHVTCGWFASAVLIDPRLFRRVRYNDCLVNDGAPLAPGDSVSFSYANSFSYPLGLSTASCF